MEGEETQVYSLCTSTNTFSRLSCLWRLPVKGKKEKNLFPFKNLVYRFSIKACLLVLQSHFSNCLGLVSNLLFLLRYYFPMINPLIFVLTVKREFKSTFTVLTLCAILWITHRFAFIRKLNTGTSKKYK